LPADTSDPFAKRDEEEESEHHSGGRLVGSTNRHPERHVEG